MNNVPRETLRRIVIKYGKGIGSDRRRCEGLLNDLCGAYRREINVLVEAVEERIPEDLTAGASSMPVDLLLNRLEKRLESQTGLSAEAARWAVESWALALGAVTDEEIGKRRKLVTDSHPVKDKSTQITPPLNKSPNPPVSNTNPRSGGSTGSGSGNIVFPKNQPPPSPHTNPQPANPNAPQAPPSSTGPYAPPPYRQPANQQPIPQPVPKQRWPRANPAALPKSRRFGIFRGCLILFFLLALTSVFLLFGVPYAIDVMRETQRERENEPPRFPVR